MEKEINNDKQKKNLQKIKEYLKIGNYTANNILLDESVKELCVYKLCNVLGINCKINFKNRYFEFFSSVLGEVLCEKLGINVHIAKDEIRFIKYSGINFIDKSRQILERESLDEAILDIFNFVENNKWLLC